MVKFVMSLYEPFVFPAPFILDVFHSLGTCALGIFGNSGALEVSRDGGAAPVSVGIDDGAGVGGCCF